MFGNFQTFSQIKSAPEIERCGQVRDDKALRIDLELASVYIVTVHADYIADCLDLPLS